MIDWRDIDIQNHLWQIINKPNNTGRYVRVGGAMDRVRVPKAKHLITIFAGVMTAFIKITILSRIHPFKISPIIYNKLNKPYVLYVYMCTDERVKKYLTDDAVDSANRYIKNHYASELQRFRLKYIGGDYVILIDTEGE